MIDQPILPYAGTSGWSGSETSQARAVKNDKDGTTKKTQAQTLMLILQAAYFGITWKELSEMTGWHHGTASGVLSVLDKTGRIVRLKQTRNRCAVYVSLGWIENRPIAVRKIKTCKNCGHEQ
jgi:DNA-binding MarR family transcriptional regulator